MWSLRERTACTQKRESTLLTARSHCDKIIRETVIIQTGAYMTTVYFVRHAEPNFDNHDDRSRELSPKGMADRALVTEFLRDKGIDAVFSSPYKRAYDTVFDFAEKMRLVIETVEDFRERKVGYWVEDFAGFSERQWKDFGYRLSKGESLRQVQDRNIAALEKILIAHRDKSVVIGTHGTALSTVINYYDGDFGYEDFERIKGLMPWIVRFRFDGKDCIAIDEYDIFGIK